VAFEVYTISIVVAVAVSVGITVTGMIFRLFEIQRQEMLNQIDKPFPPATPPPPPRKKKKEEQISAEMLDAAAKHSASLSLQNDIRFELLRILDLNFLISKSGSGYDPIIFNNGDDKFQVRVDILDSKVEVWRYTKKDHVAEGKYVVLMRSIPFDVPFTDGYFDFLLP